MSALISGSIRARGIKFGIKLSIYITQVKFILIYTYNTRLMSV